MAFAQEFNYLSFRHLDASYERGLSGLRPSVLGTAYDDNRDRSRKVSRRKAWHSNRYNCWVTGSRIVSGWIENSERSMTGSLQSRISALHAAHWINVRSPGDRILAGSEPSASFPLTDSAAAR